jgi:hypothetical protein
MNVLGIGDVVTVALGILAAVGLVGAIWRKVLRPLLRVFATLEALFPLLVELQQQLGGTPGAFAILREIVGQLRTDSGSSLRDVVNRLDAAAAANAQAAEILKVGVAVQNELAREDRQLAREDRQRAADLFALVKASGATGLRIEAAAEHVAEDLAARHQRADEVSPDQPAGSASDAANRQADP